MSIIAAIVVLTAISAYNFVYAIDSKNVGKAVSSTLMLIAVVTIATNL